MSDFQVDSVLEGQSIPKNEEEEEVIINQPKDFELTEDHKIKDNNNPAYH
jgi:hypothetical protein